MFRSSIFSFETLRGVKPRWPLSALAVLGLLLAIELTVRAIPEEKLIPPKSRQGEIFYIEREVLPKYSQPKVLFLGSSRIRRAVVPRQFDERLGLGEFSTLNAGLASGRIFEAQYLYRRNEALLKSAQVVVLNLDEWHLSSGYKLGSLYETHAPFAERLALPERLQTRMVLDGAFTSRIKLGYIPRAIQAGLGMRKEAQPDLVFDANHQLLPPPRRNMEAGIDPRVFASTIADHYEHFAISPVMKGHAAQLCAAVRANGGQFVLMQLPNRAGYQGEVERLKSAEYAAHVAAAKELAAELKVPFLYYGTPGELGLDDSDFVDYGHINAAGAAKATESLARLFEREGWLKR